MDRERVLPRSPARMAQASVLAAPMIVLATIALAQVPTIDIRQTCKAAAGVMYNLSVGGAGATDDVQICLNSENSARDQLDKNWSAFQASDRAGCIQRGVYLPSYVEWLTCFEMNKVVREVKKQGRQMKTIENADGTFSLPPRSSLGILSGGSR
jgi:hypothetical protein